MTTRKTFKHRVRARMEKTGERYGGPSERRRRRVEYDSNGEASFERTAPVSDEAVRKATGLDWDEWLAILDDVGAAGWKHPDIARWLVSEHRISGWWAQSVTVGLSAARAARRARATDGVLAQRDEDRQRPGRTAVRGVRRCEATQRLAGARGPRPLVDGTADHQPRLGRRLGSARASRRGARSPRWRSSRIHCRTPRRSRSCGRSGGRASRTSSPVSRRAAPLARPAHGAGVIAGCRRHNF